MRSAFCIGYDSYKSVDPPMPHVLTRPTAHGRRLPVGVLLLLLIVVALAGRLDPYVADHASSSHTTGVHVSYPADWQPAGITQALGYAFAPSDPHVGYLCITQPTGDHPFFATDDGGVTLVAVAHSNFGAVASAPTPAA